MNLLIQSKLSHILTLSCKLCLIHLNRLMGYMYRVEQVEKRLRGRPCVRGCECAWVDKREGELVSWVSELLMKSRELL